MLNISFVHAACTKVELLDLIVCIVGNGVAKSFKPDDIHKCCILLLNKRTCLI